MKAYRNRKNNFFEDFWLFYEEMNGHNMAVCVCRIKARNHPQDEDEHFLGIFDLRRS
jgi:hypothetical protein